MSQETSFRLLLLGAPGAGKTTISKVLAQRWNLCLVKTGDMMRQFAVSHHDDSLLKKLDRGEMMDNGLVAQLVRERIESGDCERGFISDGYPRLLSQLKVYDPKFDRAIYLRVPEEILLARLEYRGRSDDTAEAVRRRMSIFKEETLPVIEYYRKLDKLLQVDGSGEVEAVVSQIMEELSHV